MGILFNEKERLFHLSSKNTSYIFQVFKNGYLAHLYWGKKLRDVKPEHLLYTEKRAWTACSDLSDKTYSLDTLPQEYPSYGNTDLRPPAYQIQLENGTTITDLRYVSHKIYFGKPEILGLPATYAENNSEAQTLEIELFDELIGLKASLSYTIFDDLDAITRSVTFRNCGTTNLKILRALSTSVDFNHSDFDLLHLSGAWARERHIQRRPLIHGSQGINNSRGGSGHQHNPFIALLSKNTNEYNGEVYAFSLIYSGNFTANVDVDQFYSTRVTMGINPFDFSWLLMQGESFQTPEVVMVYTDKGLSSMSNIFHKLYRTRLCRGYFRDKNRPVLINNWEATYFDFNAEKLLEIVKTAKELGIELFVLDDGWFGKRNTDNCSLGDWVVNKEKLPMGLDGLAKAVNDEGLEFGLWFEPEMVSPDSDLYRTHPDWCIHVPGRSRSEERNQLILDLSRIDVQDEIIKMLSNVLLSSPITYVKWDMNRHMSEIGSSILPPERQKETAHRYILGLYRILNIITTTFPKVLFESCSGGGGRYDPAMLYYMPQTWTSDDTDAIARLKIQYGTSIVYPASTMGAHISAVPNHQLHRNTSLKVRGDVAMSGNFGYELDLSKFTEEEKEIAKRQVTQYKEIRSLIQFGEFYRLLSPFEGNDAAWMYVSEDRSEVFVTYIKVLAEPNAPKKYLTLKGLDIGKDYTLVDSGESYGGDELMNAGIQIPNLEGDFQSTTWHFKSI